MAELVDGHGRRVTYVRISVTDRCNLRCVYCMPEDQKFRPLPHLMTREEISRAASLLKSFGIQKVRLTGGEPTTRPDLPGIVADLSSIGFPGGIALSTNGVLFPGLANELLASGLTKVNISLDSADAGQFQKMARRDRFRPVMEAIEVALSLPFDAVKLNAVVIRSVNGDQVSKLAAMTFDKNLAVRFIEYMPYGDNGWQEDDWVGWEEIRARLETEGFLFEPIVRSFVAGPAEEFRVTSGRGPHRGSVGFISPVSGRFCDSCNRMRLTQDGFLKGCLFGHADVDLLGPMRSGASDELLAQLVERAAAGKEESHPMFVGMSRPGLALHRRNMGEVGG